VSPGPPKYEGVLTQPRRSSEVGKIKQAGYSSNYGVDKTGETGFLCKLAIPAIPYD